MTILLACECSGIVRDAFIARGHVAWSCDLQPCERGSDYHFQRDVFDVIEQGWDMMIAFPPCTYLTYAGTAHWNKPGRAELRDEAMQFFKALCNARIHKIAVENPFGLPCQEFRKPDQIINPFDFGEPIRKRTCLWLKNLPVLTRGDELWGRSQYPVPAPEPIYVGTRIATGKRKARHSVDSMRPRRIHYTEAMSSDAARSKARSRSFESIARAMAEQWG